MPTVKRFVLGLRTASKMFRVNSIGGVITDRLLSLRGKDLDDDYFDAVSSDKDRSYYQLHNIDKGNYFRLDHENAVFTKDFYVSGKHFRFDDVLSEFRAIWHAVNAEMQIHDVRRIGVVCEYRYPCKVSGGGELLAALTRFKSGDDSYIGRFLLRFEQRSLDAGGKVPDLKKGSFINRILEIYDSIEDTDNPEEGMYNVNLDVQKYFTPLLNGNVPDEVLRLYNTQFVPASKQEFERLRKLGLVDG